MTTEIPDESFAFIVNSDESYEFLIPGCYGDDRERPLPRMGVFLSAIACRAADPEFIDEMIEWMERQIDKAN
ncbi:MAG TPA: hypothetical protein VGK56_11110 [Anaerolineales bacterium]